MDQSRQAITLLRRWRGAGFIRPVDCALGELVAQKDNEAPLVVPVCAAVASRRAADGHTGFTADELVLQCRNPATPLGAVFRDITSEKVQSALQKIPWAAPDGSGPLVWDTTATPPVIRLRRMFRAHEDLALLLAERSATTPDPCLPGNQEPRTSRVLDLLFPGDHHPQDTAHEKGRDFQRVAAETAMQTSLTVITGGPGTGKTTTVVRLLALLMALWPEESGTPRILLAAPTGKAAMRMETAVSQGIATLPEAVFSRELFLRENFPRRVQTIHRLLAIDPRRARSRYHRDNPLDADALVVDEASMINLELMVLLLKAVPPHCRLILLGDEHQLAAVEPGAVLADLCRSLPREEGAGIPHQPAVVYLHRTYRFSRDSGIAALADAVRRGDRHSAERILSREHDDLKVVHIESFHDAALRSVVHTVLEHYQAAITNTTDDPHPLEILKALDHARILSPVRQGPWGVDRISRIIDALLAPKNHLREINRWYNRQPLMVTRNDYQTGLMNGDTGVILHSRGALRAFFPGGPSEEPRSFAPGRLPPTEGALALTVHKAQGSEFDHVVLVVPDQRMAVLNRALLYTAITRARRSVTIVESRREIFLDAVDEERGANYTPEPWLTSM